MTDLWMMAGEEAERDASDHLLALARVACACYWPVVASVTTKEGLDHAKALISDGVTTSVTGIATSPAETAVLASRVLDSFSEDWEAHIAAKQAVVENAPAYAEQMGFGFPAEPLPNEAPALEGEIAAWEGADQQSRVNMGNGLGVSDDSSGPNVAGPGANPGETPLLHASALDIEAGLEPGDYRLDAFGALIRVEATPWSHLKEMNPGEMSDQELENHLMLHHNQMSVSDYAPLNADKHMEIHGNPGQYGSARHGHGAYSGEEWDESGRLSHLVLADKAPYYIREEGGKFKVVNREGEVKGTFDSKDAARQQQKALYVNIPDAPGKAEKAHGHTPEAVSDVGKKASRRTASIRLTALQQQAVRAARALVDQMPTEAQHHAVAKAMLMRARGFELSPIETDLVITAALQRVTERQAGGGLDFTRQAADDRSHWPRWAARVHTFDDSGHAYNRSQTDDEIKNGDVFHIPEEGITGYMHKAWPTAVTQNKGAFHGLEEPASYAGPRGEGHKICQTCDGNGQAKPGANAPYREPGDTKCWGCGGKGHYEGDSLETVQALHNGWRQARELATQHGYPVDGMGTTAAKHSAAKHSAEWHQGFEHGVSGQAEQYPDEFSPEQVDDYSDGHEEGRRSRGRSDDDRRFLSSIHTADGVPESKRDRAEKAGDTLPGTDKFPIENARDLEKAKHDIGRTNEPHDKVVNYIDRKAEELGEPGVGEDDEGKKAALQKGAPFAGYKDFHDCVRKNQDKDDPEAYCGQIKHQVEGSRQGRMGRLWDRLMGRTAQGMGMANPMDPSSVANPFSPAQDVNAAMTDTNPTMGGGAAGAGGTMDPSTTPPDEIPGQTVPGSATAASSKPRTKPSSNPNAPNQPSPSQLGGMPQPGMMGGTPMGGPMLTSMPMMAGRAQVLVASSILNDNPEMSDDEALHLASRTIERYPHLVHQAYGGFDFPFGEEDTPGSYTVCPQCNANTFDGRSGHCHNCGYLGGTGSPGFDPLVGPTTIRPGQFDMRNPGLTAASYSVRKCRSCGNQVRVQLGQDFPEDHADYCPEQADFPGRKNREQ
jgi:hypothetical protein